jgi:hypothetical protein
MIIPAIALFTILCGCVVAWKMAEPEPKLTWPIKSPTPNIRTLSPSQLDDEDALYLMEQIRKAKKQHRPYSDMEVALRAIRHRQLARG